jgi:sedoheptulokinase
MIAAGIDIGTTNIELFLVDLESCRIRERRFAPNKRVDSADPLAYFQDPQGIINSVREMLASVSLPISSLGITGQVHGIVYADEKGAPLSPLYTWLDRHGSEVLGKISVQKQFAEKTGLTLPVGYGLLTHYANRLFGRVPGEARRILGINELVCGALTEKPLEKTDATNLACFGAFDPVKNVFFRPALEEALSPPAALAPLAFLDLAEPFTLAGETPLGIPVAYPVGDNQAGFLGLVARPAETCLISIGTSGQISVYSPSEHCPPGMELRPYLGLGYLHVGATLAAGKAYEVLAELFRDIIRRAGPASSSGDDTELFRLMKEAARESPPADPLVFDTALNGTRRDPERRGSITGISLDNFTMGSLVRGSINGIVRELAEFKRDLGDLFEPVRSIVAAGSAVRKNELFRESLEQQFNREILVPEFDGGSALGAAFIGALAAKLIVPDDLEGIIRGFWEQSPGTPGGPVY